MEVYHYIKVSFAKLKSPLTTRRVRAGMTAVWAGSGKSQLF